MRTYVIESKRDGSSDFREKARIEADSGFDALRGYGCNVQKGRRTHKTRKGTQLRARKA